MANSKNRLKTPIDFDMEYLTTQNAKLLDRAIARRKEIRQTLINLSEEQDRLDNQIEILSDIKTLLK
jgi:hypothetical protein